MKKKASSKKNRELNDLPAPPPESSYRATARAKLERALRTHLDLAPGNGHLPVTRAELARLILALFDDRF